MRGFYWTANSPYIQGMWPRVRRAPRAPALSTTITDGLIPLTLTNGRTMQNANPAFIIYECLTNTDWGMGGAPEEIDVPSFQAAAQLWRDENFGLFMLWSRQSAIDDFIGDVLDHVQAVLFLNPATGLLTLKPLRGDYDVDSLPVFDPTNCKVEDFDRMTWGETINEIVVSWTNPITEQTETVGAQDLANVVQQGGQIVSQPRNYYGVRSGVLAQQLAHRDLRTACAPLTTWTLKATRAAFDLTPGACFVLNWPEEDAIGIVGRVQTIDYGNKTNGEITATVIQDIFSLDTASYTGAAVQAGVNPSLPPTVIERIFLTTAPAYVVANSADRYVEQPEYPEVNTLFLAAGSNRDFLGYEPYTGTTLANGSPVLSSVGLGRSMSFYDPIVQLPAEPFTTIPAFSGYGTAPKLADLVFIADEEIALVQQVNEDGTLVLARGVLDTVPKAFAVGAALWIGDPPFIDTTARAPGETVNYRLLMRTSLGMLPYSQAVDQPITLTERPYLPLRPANVKVNGVGFGTAALGGGNATVTWSTRNRLMETSQILGWTAGPVPPESGQTTTVEVLNGSTVLKTFAGLTGNSTTVLAADLAGGNRIRVSSSRGGAASLFSFSVAYTA